jgi:salicylate synthetase
VRPWTACCSRPIVCTAGWPFEFGAYRFGLQHRLPPGTPLARIFQPHAQLVITETEVRFGDADTRYTRVLRRLLADGVPAAPPAAPIDVSGDGADYCGRVATAIGEIEERRYQKVILSRRFDVPFALDFPATYRVGRRHNTPARSFLLRTSGIRALGFSPELVAAVTGTAWW